MPDEPQNSSSSPQPMDSHQPTVSLVNLPSLPLYHAPSPVLDYVASAGRISDAQRVLAWMGILAGAVMTLVGFVAVAMGACMVFVMFQGGATWDFIEKGISLLVGGLVFLIPGYLISGKCLKRVNQ